MEALEKRRREPTVDPQRTETVSSDSEWLETVSEKVNLVGRYLVGKYTPHGSLQTVGPAHFKTADEVGKKTPIKRKSSTQNESPPPSTEATRRAHTIITQKERGHCGHCLNVRKLGTASRLEKKKRAARTTRFCLDCNMFLCMACTKSRRQHRVAYKRRRIK